MNYFLIAVLFIFAVFMGWVITPQILLVAFRKRLFDSVGGRKVHNGVVPRLGGVVFAPVPRDYSFKLNKKEKRAALKSALTSRVNESKFIVVDELKLDSIKTKNFVQVLNNLKVEKALVVLNDNDVNVIKSASNVPTVKTAQTNELNVFDVLKYDTVVVTKDAVKTIEEVYA